MYDRHKPIIKWYEYDARKLYQTAESEDVTEEIPAEVPAEPVQEQAADTNTGEALGNDSDGHLTGSELDEEVARIMAAFSGAKQNGVDDVFAMMAAEAEAAGSGSDDGEEAGADQGNADDTSSEKELLASILAPKQNNVDDLVAKAREG